MNAMVIKSWSVQTDAPDNNGNYIQIDGRSGGLVSWLLNLMGIRPTVSMSVRADRISFEAGSLEGFMKYHIPLENVCATYYGYSKPWKAAIVFGVIVGILTNSSLGIPERWIAMILLFVPTGMLIFLLGIPGVIAGVLYYLLNKTLTVGFVDVGGHPYRIDFKRSVIEGQRIDEVKAGSVCGLIQSLIQRRTASQIAQAQAPLGTERSR